MDGMRTKTKVLSLAALLAGSVVFGMILAGSLDLTRLATAQKASPAASAPSAVPASRPAGGATLALPSFADIAEQIEPAIVSVTATDIVKADKRRRSYHNFGGGDGGQDPFEFFFGPRGRGNVPGQDRRSGARTTTRTRSSSRAARASSSSPRATSSRTTT